MTRLGLAAVFFGVFGVASAAHPVRTWTSNDGKKIEAAMLEADRESVTLKLKTGQEVRVPLDRLSAEDRSHVEALNSTGESLRIGPMPLETKVETSIPVEGGPTAYTTRNFSFECETPVTKAFISEAARVFEGTLEAVRLVPLGIDPKPAKGETLFRTRFLERSTFEQEFERVRASGNPGGATTAAPAQGTSNVANVAGVYFPMRKEVLVPYSSLGVTMSGSKVSLRKSSDTSTLIHEVTHQVMHDWLVVTPLWIGEGLAEYFSAIPYQNGRFEFKNAEAGLKETLLEDYRIQSGETVPVIRPSEFFTLSNADWVGTPDEYLSAMMVIYYLIHLDQPDKPGASLAAYLSLIRQSKENVDTLITNFNSTLKDFENKRLAYNKEVDAYNAALARFKSEVEEYNFRVSAYNEQVRAGIAEESRVKVGDEPVPPTPPADLEVPAILKENSSDDGRPIDFLAKVRDAAMPGLLRGRTPEQLDEALVAAYEAKGIRVKLSRAPRSATAEPFQVKTIPF